MTVIVTLKKMAWADHGHVILRKVANGPAPSTSAASSSSLGTSWRAARKISIAKPTLRQMSTMITVHRRPAMCC